MRFAELVEVPGEGRVFEHQMLPGIADVSPTRRARLDAIARWLQDVAFLDLLNARVELPGAWILRRLRIRVESFPRLAERLRLRTFCSGLGRFAAERRTSVHGPNARVEAVAVWVYLDPTSLTPQRLPSEFLEPYSASAAGRGASVRLRHPDPPADAARESWSFDLTDVDPALHVNNSHCWEPFEAQLLRDGEPDAIDAEIEHHQPAEAGAVEVLSSGDGIWIAGLDGAVQTSIMRAA